MSLGVNLLTIVVFSLSIYKMPGCTAENCSNSAKKGFLMKRFPRDPTERKEWVIKTKRDKWTPTDHSSLCEVLCTNCLWGVTNVINSVCGF
jgi:hypothetical protein